jgi:outer membrane protein
VKYKQEIIMKHKNILILAALMAAAGAATAQKAGALSASVGVTKLAPDVSSGVLSGTPGATSDVTSNTQLTGAVNYGLSDTLTLHLPIGFGFKHDIIGQGFAAGTGKLAEVKALPITAIVQYRFGSATGFQPYAGGGLTYARFYKARGTAALTSLTNLGGPATTLKVASKLAPTIQLGAAYHINEKWYVDGSYTKTFLKTRATMSTGQTLDMTLNPDGYTLQVGYKF